MPFDITSLEYLYEAKLQIISGVKFTPREIDIMACVISGKSPQSIANFLSTPNRSIELQTVNTHIVNIRRKIDGNSRGSIITFIERSDKHKMIHQYYLMLLMEQEFTLSLRDKILSLLSNTQYLSVTIKLVAYQNDNCVKSTILAKALYKILIGLGIKLEIVEKSNLGHINRLNNYTIHILPLASDYKNNITFSNNHIILSMDELENAKALAHHICLQQMLDNYEIVCAILKYLFPSISQDLGQMIQTYCHRYNDILSRYSGHQTIKDQRSDSLELEGSKLLSKKSVISTIVTVFCIIVFAMSFVTYNKLQKGNISSTIQSDLNLPVECYLLHRNNLIQEIHKKFKRSANIQILAITGPGGAGKTTLAHQYAIKQKANVIWGINASTFDNLKESFEQLAEALSESEEDHKQLNAVKRISDSKERAEKILALVKKGLNKRSDWLLIFDNVENITELGKYIPKDSYVWGDGRVIITTRDGHIKDNQYVHHTVELGELTNDQKLALFQKILKTKNLDIDKMQAFLGSIPPFPLDISVAAHYLKSTNISYSEYLEYLANHSIEFEEIQSSLLKEIGEYEKTRYNIITVSLQRVMETHQDFPKLLLFISLIDSHNIPRELLYKYKNHIIVDSFIYNLKKYSLLTSRDNSSNLSLLSWHQSTQSIALDYLNKKLSLEVNKKTLKEIATILRLYVEELIDSEDSIKTALLVTHCEKLLLHKKIITKEIQSLTEVDLGIIYYHLGYNIEAKKILERSIVDLEHYQDQIPYADALTYLGLVERRKGNYRIAEQLMMRSIVIYQAYPEKYQDLAQIFALLGNVYRPMGEYNKAKHLIEKSLKIYQEHNDYDVGYAKTLIYLGNVHRLLGEYKKATELCEQALVIYRKHPENYSGLARNLEYLGMLYNETGLHDKALTMMRESHENYERHYGDCNNIQCDTSQMFLGIIYTESGDHEKAKEILSSSLIAYENHYGKDHAEAAFAKFHLARACARLGELEKGQSLLEESLFVHKKHFGDNHPKIANILQFLGYIYFAKGDFEKAEKVVIESMNIFNHHPSCYKSLELLGDIYMSKQDKERAYQYFVQALDITERNFPAGSAHIKRVKNKIDVLLLQQ